MFKFDIKGYFLVQSVSNGKMKKHAFLKKRALHHPIVSLLTAVCIGLFYNKQPYLSIVYKNINYLFIKLVKLQL